MSAFWSLAGWPLIILAAAVLVYFVVIKPKLAETAVVTGKAETVAAANGLAKVWAILEGWKTIILTAVAGAVQFVQLLPEDVIHQWSQLPWASVFDQALANKITLTCTFLIAVTHTMGIVKAAKTPPQS